MARRKRKSAAKKPWRLDRSLVEQVEKPYHTIGEVAKMFEVEETQLRYWEEHTPLSPKRSNNSGARMYSKEDLELVEKIRYLLQDKGLSLAAVDAQLKGEEIQVELEIRDKLFAIRDRVEQLKKMVSQQLGREEDDNI